jgi:hypothetical protein
MGVRVRGGEPPPVARGVTGAVALALGVNGVMGATPAPSPALPLASIDLASDGQVYELDLSAGDYEPRVTSGNGGALTYGPAIGWNNEPGVRIDPPTVVMPSGNAEYCCLLSSALGGLRAGITRFNMRFMVYFAPAYGQATRGFDTKFVGPAPTSARWLSNIQAAGNTPANMAAVAVAIGTFKNYWAEPDYSSENDEWSWNAEPGLAALFVGPGPDHTGSATSGTPVIGNEWVCFEYHYDYAGGPAAHGEHRLHVWTADGVLSGQIMRCDGTINDGSLWSGPGEWGGFEATGVGGFWNGAIVPGTTDAHSFYSHFAFSPNRTAANPIGPPPGFVTG